MNPEKDNLEVWYVRVRTDSHLVSCLWYSSLKEVVDGIVDYLTEFIDNDVAGYEMWKYETCGTMGDFIKLQEAELKHNMIRLKEQCNSTGTFCFRWNKYEYLITKDRTILELPTCDRSRFSEKSTVESDNSTAFLNELRQVVDVLAPSAILLRNTFKVATAVARCGAHKQCLISTMDTIVGFQWRALGINFRISIDEEETDIVKYQITKYDRTLPLEENAPPEIFTDRKSAITRLCSVLAESG